MQQNLSTREAAEVLGVSSATVRNWHRAGHLAAAAKEPLSFTAEAVEVLKERIRTNRFNRLRRRANKSASEAPPRDPIDPGLAIDIDHLRRVLADSDLDPGNFLYVAALRYLKLMGEARYPDDGECVPERIEWRRKTIAEIMRDWRQRIPGPIFWPNPRDIDGLFDARLEEDRLGILYQGLSSVGKQSRLGAYFTPNHIIDEALEDFGVAPDSFLDPCCGTGRYLIRAACRYRLKPTAIYGFDSDPTAVDIARLNLLLLYRDTDTLPRIRCLDSLNELANGRHNCDTNHLLGNIHAIATNPPWGGCKNTTRHQRLVETIRTGESFSLFLEKSLRLLREDGVLSFILPESMLKIRAHAGIRQVLVANASIKKITMLGRVFAGVFTPVMRMDLVKRAAPPGWQVAVHRRGKCHHCPQERFAMNSGCSFDITVTPRDEELLAKIYRVEHHTLKDNAEWAVGIVTGDNGRHVLEAPGKGTEPVVKGRDVDKFATRPVRCHILFRPELYQQVAPERHYRAPEKLIYRFVSERLIFAYDDKGLLTLNSANILIPRVPGLSIKAALAFLNSMVFQYIFTKRFRTRKILRGDLETLPFPNIAKSQALLLERQVNRCMTGEYQPADELDVMVFRIFGLTDDDVADIRTGLEVEEREVIF